MVSRRLRIGGFLTEFGDVRNDSTNGMDMLQMVVQEADCELCFVKEAFHYVSVVHGAFLRGCSFVFLQLFRGALSLCLGAHRIWCSHHFLAVLEECN